MNKIMSLTGASIGVAGTLLGLIDGLMWVSVICAITGVGVGVAAAVIAYRVAIQRVLWTAGKAAAIQL